MTLHIVVYVVVFSLLSLSISFPSSNILLINSIQYFDRNELAKLLDLRVEDIAVIEGSIITYYALSLKSPKYEMIVIIAHGSGNTISTTDEVSLMKMIIHGPAALFRLLTVLYVPSENKYYYAFTAQYFKYLFNPKTEKVIIISCDVDELIHILKSKGYEVYLSTTPKPLHEIIRG